MNLAKVETVNGKRLRNNLISTRIDLTEIIYALLVWCHW